jgi:FKBP-type peptidyl-prolyl cis-trans isomerase FkpA
MHSAAPSDEANVLSKSPLNRGIAQVIVVGFLSCGLGSPALAQAPSPTSNMNAKVTQLKKIEVKPGTGAEAVKGKKVVVHYTGWLYDPAAADQTGTKFDSSRDRGQPFDFPLGEGRVIRGWDEGVAGMKVGGQRTLIIPPDMAYGSRGAGGVIPPDATLIFDVELLDVKG